MNKSEFSLVSIMMPAYNAEVFIAQSISSVLQQTYENWELIIVNDGSVDRTKEIISQFRDPRIKVFHQDNQGEAAARNIALKGMKGKWVAFLDADDLFTPDFLEKTIHFLNQFPQFDAVYTDGWHIDHQGRQLDMLSQYRRGPFAGNICEQLIRASDVFGPPICTVLKRSPIIENQLAFDERIVIGPDWDFMTRYAEKTKFGYLDKPLCKYRVHQTNITVKVGSVKRRQSLAICRENAMANPYFMQCGIETRTAVFYDYFVNLVYDQPEKVDRMLEYKYFLQLPEDEQIRLLRLAAAESFVTTGESNFPKKWLKKARELNKRDKKTLILSILLFLNPALARAWIAKRRQNSQQKWGTTPFEIQTNET